MCKSDYIYLGGVGIYNMYTCEGLMATSVPFENKVRSKLRKRKKYMNNFEIWIKMTT